MGVMKKTACREVAIEPNRGVVFYDDTACRLKNYHDKGVRNIYSVVLTYAVPNHGKKVMRLDYGKFHQAQMRFYTETSTEERPTKMKLNSIKLLVETFKGTKKINSDVLRHVVYGKRNVKAEFEGRIGEEGYE